MNWIIFSLIWVVILTAGIAGFSAAPWVPTKRSTVDLLINGLNIKPGNIVYDLGCGTGTILVALARKHPDANFIGCEISILPYLIAKVRSTRYSNITVQYKNLFKQDLSNADFIIAFLMPKAYPKLIEQIKGKLKPSATIALEAWAMKNIEPIEKLEGEQTLPFYTYKGSSL